LNNKENPFKNIKLSKSIILDSKDLEENKKSKEKENPQTINFSINFDFSSGDENKNELNNAVILSNREKDNFLN